ncbi:MAG: acetyl-CoA carboxylase carboxyl transferase subunit alpha [Oscillospiraceae bacterium]|nr:acetyl-CoA carboxylase carboxyl transferase subunit alpha [Oscillospiraceae bacterium]MBR1459585.1 acetyl-CoA carboxylase carboxyl transferase subunit alpha [Oscillospiraceae bacterium]MBR1897493.1 acetyl-CoA carboxylase carboxyl transferase subunit alpha [Oscillospiraceae bacterium]
MDSYEKLKTARKNGRPTGGAYVREIFEFPIELHGDRRFGDDLAIMGGVAYIDKRPVTFLAMEKGTDLESRLKRNFGCPKPEGYRKALRLMKQAEKFGRPVVCFVDTLGAYPGADAEERGQGQAIAESIMEMMGLRTPVITVVIGEGGSGGALALASANKVFILENAVYSVISPEGCASILWKESTPENVAKAADCLHITADDMKEFGVAEAVIPEDFEKFPKMCKNLKNMLVAAIDELSAMSGDEIVEQRYQRFRSFGIYEEKAEKLFFHKKK